MNNAASRHAIDGQLTPNNVLDDALLAQIAQVDRAAFVPESHQHAAYVDQPIALGQGRVLLPPLSVGLLLKYADVQPHHRVLYVGSGYGYGPALLAGLVEHVCAVEELSEGGEHARRFFSQNRTQAVEIFTGALAAGHGENAPYDRIIIEGAVEFLPDALMEQLGVGGSCIAIKRKSNLANRPNDLGQITVWTHQEQYLSAKAYDELFAPILPGFERAEGFVL